MGIVDFAAPGLKALKIFRSTDDRSAAIRAFRILLDDAPRSIPKHKFAPKRNRRDFFPGHVRVGDLGNFPMIEAKEF